MAASFLTELQGDIVALPLGWLVVTVGVVGALVGVAALVTHRGRAGFALGMVALTMAIASASIGSLAVILARARTDDRIATAEPTDAAAPTETWKQRTRRAGYERARRGAALGLLFAGPSLFAGLYGVLAPMVRRRKPRPMSMRMPRSLRSQAKHEWSSSVGSAAGLAAGGLALLSVGTATVVWTLPLPGPALAQSDRRWEAFEALERMRAGAFDAGCTELVQACDRVCRWTDDPELESAANECAHLRLDAFIERRDVETLTKLHALSTSGLPYGDLERVEIQRELDRVRHEEPGPVQPVPGP